MKMLKKLLVISTLSFTLIGFGTVAGAATQTHVVQKGDTFWNIGSKYGVSVLSLMNHNNKTTSLVYPGEKLNIPAASLSASDKDLLARLVSAEAKGESYAGKVAVATVILNRVNHPDFPNTVSEVVYQIDQGFYAFTPVQNGTINQAADEESKRAVAEALAFQGQGQGSLYFYNPQTAASSWVFSRETTITIGNHRFAK
ncbi:cell wall hydrolase [Robertmurraya korlensis]|uniref:cell wall hydrolase n=1 Tax=Robertmurraya korlensis TaxID=519977 RepID=UPI000824FBB9|nr:cell wall hydrolase [Robertmurraya korlensis]